MELANMKTPPKAYATPILPEDHSTPQAGAPGEGPVVECPWCHHAAPPYHLLSYGSLAELAKVPKVLPVTTGVQPQQGELHDVASRILMKVL